MPYNVHATRGKKKGKFAKLKVVKAADKLAERCKERALKKNSTQFEYEVVDGHRIIEISKVADDLWCIPCNQPLSLRFVVKQKVQGLVNIFYIQCHNCLSIYEIETSKTSSNLCDSNTKLAIAMLDAGVSETKINTILSALNVPTVNSKFSKRWERFGRKTIDDLAHSSCVDAIKEEGKLTLEIREKN